MDSASKAAVCSSREDLFRSCMNYIMSAENEKFIKGLGKQGVAKIADLTPEELSGSGLELGIEKDFKRLLIVLSSLTETVNKNAQQL